MILDRINEKLYICPMLDVNDDFARFKINVTPYKNKMEGTNI